MSGPRTQIAAWRHHTARDGFECVLWHYDSGHRFSGHTAAVEDGRAWAVHYDIDVDDRWRTRAATVSASRAGPSQTVHIEADGDGRWSADGTPLPHLNGCLDLDLESSACTNTLPIHRLALRDGQAADAPAAYLRFADLRVERLEQRYLRISDVAYAYRAPAFDFACELTYDQDGLIIDYPGIATRVW